MWIVGGIKLCLGNESSGNTELEWCASVVSVGGVVGTVRVSGCIPAMLGAACSCVSCVLLRALACPASSPQLNPPLSLLSPSLNFSSHHLPLTILPLTSQISM